MSRTKGSGWGGGVLFYQECPLCGKKKAIYDWMYGLERVPFRCLSCKERFNSNTLIHLKYREDALKAVTGNI
jgi:hypothetical protein